MSAEPPSLLEGIIAAAAQLGAARVKDRVIIADSMETARAAARAGGLAMLEATVGAAGSHVQIAHMDVFIVPCLMPGTMKLADRGVLGFTSYFVPLPIPAPLATELAALSEHLAPTIYRRK